jgi:hypothetical protein
MMSDHLIPGHLPGVDGSPSDPEHDEHASQAAVFPPALRPRLVEAVTAPALPVPFDDFLIGNEALPHWVNREALSRHLRTDAAAARCALVIEAEQSPDVLMVFMPGIDRVSHWLWGSLEPADSYPDRFRPTPPEREAGVAALHRYYEYVDALIGRVTASADADDLVIVLSDHGFEGGGVPSRPELSGRHESKKALHGLFFARGSGIPAGSSSEGLSINDVTPTILAWLGLPLGLDMDGGVALFLDHDEALAPQPVDSYDSDPIERLEPGDDANTVVLDQLRELGYIE